MKLKKKKGRKNKTMKIEEFKFDEKGLIPAIVQDYRTGEVLMLAYMNKESIKKTLETGRTWFWSRSRQQYWCKGETSGNVQYVKEVKYDCDADTLLILIEQVGVACHTGERSCFYRNITTSHQPPATRGKLPIVFQELYQVILDRKKKMPEGSYTAKLFEEGQDKILAKIEEESDEVIDAAKNKENSEVVWEIADLLYHLLVLLVDKGISLEEVAGELEKRRK
ncbi:bifunctional phosphoribosyl-AMP cyclohydrolase/phosphoribosyl-ATP diphosphatase HisIE [Candidatus Oleimmundimicrobium sp.]|uniref:bifunctional phosphoribosyl-AMP cyclohydrolase/phosphoribosyl-ATP diphosphatase HisIE n=1 Tax=Candidatus Oleimmundimicrobium sp. TaxID=3060597 RepID=UPI00271C76BF|nr:bifunctional phosphoribosyl-AMP cyclohydrolase/phosphoribosyl-ATP diphosphatase HisIE [Candidatus Oleimmundimicrobium sp.]MDO8886641.1 bifunctional phosphoribosyl-AMP cyclohydrolase/phosphoribosyl-ATP diphosphatase HisIE [Candidatus Oleimmundimicrobium sp.]